MIDWINRHRVLSTIIILFIFFFMMGIFISSNGETTGSVVGGQSNKIIKLSGEDNFDTLERIDTYEESEEPIIEDDFYLVTRVIDGDTIKIETGESVRLICIDTPERGESGYQEATNYVESLILGKEIELVKDVSETDKYGRLLRYVYVNGQFVNKMIVQNGYGVPYPYSPDTSKCSEIQSVYNPVVSEPEEEFMVIDGIEYDCTYNRYNCEDFPTHADAQTIYQYCISEGKGDIHRLDRDVDGLACEGLS